MSNFDNLLGEKELKLIHIIDSSLGINSKTTCTQINEQTSFFSKRCSDCLCGEGHIGIDEGKFIDCLNISSFRGSDVSASSFACNHIDPK